MLQELRYIRECDVLDMFPMSRTTLWRHVRAGLFPSPLYFGVGARIKAWNSAEVEAYRKKCVEDSLKR